MGRSEVGTPRGRRVVGEFVRNQRERFVAATKYTLSTRPGDPNSAGNRRKNMVQSLEANLRRPDTGYVDLYWVHAWDFLTPVEELMRALDDLVRSGKVLYVGVSDTPAWVVAWAITLTERNLAVADAVVEAAAEVGCTPSQVALSWLRKREGTVIPILGAPTGAQLRDNLTCLDVSLSDEQAQRLDEASAVELGFPGRFLSDPYVDQLIYAGTFGCIDPRRGGARPPLLRE